jgi:hypothetical protein
VLMSMCSDFGRGTRRPGGHSVFRLWDLGSDEGVEQAQIERPLHTEGPAEGPATSRQLQAPGIGMQVSTSAR